MNSREVVSPATVKGPVVLWPPPEAEGGGALRHPMTSHVPTTCT